MISWLLCLFGFHLHNEWYGETATETLRDGLGTLSRTRWLSVCERPGCGHLDTYGPRDS